VVVYLSVDTFILLERNGIYKMECPAKAEEGLTGTLVVGKKRKVSRILYHLKLLSFPATSDERDLKGTLKGKRMCSSLKGACGLL